MSQQQAVVDLEIAEAQIPSSENSEEAAEINTIKTGLIKQAILKGEYVIQNLNVAVKMLDFA